MLRGSGGRGQMKMGGSKGDRPVLGNSLSQQSGHRTLKRRKAADMQTGIQGREKRIDLRNSCINKASIGR